MKAKKIRNQDLMTVGDKAVKPPTQAPTPPPLKARVTGREANVTIKTRQELAAATGTSDKHLGVLLLRQVLQATDFSAGRDSEQIEETINAALAAMAELQPQDAIEGMLAAQLVALHTHAMHFLRLSTIAENIAQPEILRRLTGLSTRLSRTYTQLVETLVRYRRKAEQTVRVEHVHVHQGGQAIVGHIEHHSLEGDAHEK